ncbi:hypothetical protein TRP8649_02283 [Pelagimonas phthalicica]|uniref:DUF4399 domain-containing protein n=1 Tax=Pelagimonas phthalicica TaxID=1037362 RepID=A0A238JBX9_9RHOB|nr:DUF4399 domain-containing protein [Pelagimonas phthalicica]TDS91121.1 uncharacterized protein DUF4399 [Pelagimonas phthalicica]SMX28168.1 hypothetical protein TRP8649_02283 [Pelagimonas phthalicica]
MKHLLFAAAMIPLATASSVWADDHLAWPATEGAYVYFIDLKDGATVTSPVLVRMGVSGMGVAPAGTEREGTGHHHLLINRATMGEGEDGAEEWLYGLPADENHKHYGGGQTEASLDLPTGTHTLQMVFGDMNHVPFGPQMVSDVITITVE